MTKVSSPKNGGHRLVRPMLVLCALMLAVACGDQATQPTKLPTPTPSPSATPTPTPAPTPSPTPANREPTVTISSADSCHPRNQTWRHKGRGGVTPCTVTLQADAHDPDGDALSYRWSGCASGTARTAPCSVDQLADFTAMVTISDGHGHDVTAAKTVRGVNATPTNQMSFDCYYDAWPTSSTGSCLSVDQPDCPPVATGAYVQCGAMGVSIDGLYDQEGDQILCAEVVVTGSGCYKTNYDECNSMAPDTLFDFLTPGSATVCTYEAYMSDAWGARFKAATIRLTAVAP